MPETEIQSRRRLATLLKKAKELSILCDAVVAVIAFRSNGKLHEYSSTKNVPHILSRYENHKGRGIKVESDPSSEHRRREAPSNKEDLKGLHALKRQHAALKLKKLWRMGKNLEGLRREELCALKEEQNSALVAVLKKKEEILIKRLLKERELHAIKEKEKKKLIPYCLQLFPEKSTGFCRSSKDVSVVSNCHTKDIDTDLLRLRL